MERRGVGKKRKRKKLIEVMRVFMCCKL
jgi:hypothetical protein